MASGSGQTWPQADEVRRLLPVFALVMAVVAVVTDRSSSAADLFLAAVPVAAFVVWTYLPGVPLWILTLAVICPAVVAQRSGALEPLLFEVSLLAFVIGRWAPSLVVAVVLGLLAAASPVVASQIQDPAEIAVGIWIMGVAFPWVIGRAAARQSELTTELDASRRELAHQAVLVERRRIARDVHDLVGHGLAAVMLQITSARHVLRRDPEAVEEALRSAEDAGRRSMQELRRTVALLRSDDASAVTAALPSATEISSLVEQASAGGLAVELRTRGDLPSIPPSVGVALYRIAQEALSNAAQHAPQARTDLEIEVEGGWARLVAATSGPTASRPASEDEGAHHGLIGMRERATALGGEFDAGPASDGWRVSCRIPLEATDVAPASEVWGR